ncbi:MAG TPA: HAMP domain-containing sensor histidine kinase [Gemmataceae bacterium]|jgi:signal transduction histidine kinase
MHSRTRLPELIVGVLSIGALGVAAWVTGWPLLAVAVAAGLGAATVTIVAVRRLDADRRARLLREAVQKSERMRLLGQVSGGLAHQLRNAVAGAKLAVQLHARSCRDGDAESLDVARRQLARIEADLARFLDLGRDDVPRRPCHVVELVEEAVALLRPQCRHADVQLCWEPPAGEPVVAGDPGRLGHVVINLLTNAVDAAGPGGHVEVTVEQSENGGCQVEVWDSGPGPNAAVAGRLFEPFVTGKADGVGLGLFVARQAVAAHGGRLGWRRDRGRTCFRVELPAGDETPVLEPAAAGSR